MTEPVSVLHADLAAFALLLEAEWYNGNMEESAYLRLNRDLGGIVAKQLPLPLPTPNETAVPQGQHCAGCDGWDERYVDESCRGVTSKLDQFRRQSEDAAVNVATWPAWMQHNLTPPTEHEPS